MSSMRTNIARFGLRVGTALFTLAAVIAQPLPNASRRVALYAGVGEELITFSLDVARPITLASVPLATMPIESSPRVPL